jgi:general secretion pathway protein G
MFSKFNFAQVRDINGDGDMTDSITLTGPQCLVFFLGGLYRSGAMIGFSKNPLDPFNASGTNREGPYAEFDVGRLYVVSGGNGMPVYLDPLSQDANTNNSYLYINANDYSTATAYHMPGPVYYKPQTYQIISPGADGLYTGSPAPAAFTYDPDNQSALAGNREAEKDNITNFHSGILAP